MKKVLLFIITLLPVFALAQGTETFANIPTSSSSSYLSRSWTGDDGSTWTATQARTDQTINSSKAIALQNSGTPYVESGTISGGIGNITITTQLKFSGTSGNLTVSINGVSKGTVPYSSTVTTTSINNINVSGDFVIKISSTGSDRVAIDDVTWTAYSSPSCTEPTTAASNFGSANLAGSQLDISFTRGDGTGGVLVLAKEGSDVDAAPSPNTSYTADASFGDGDEIGTGNFVVYNGTAAGANNASGNITISNLSENTTYHFAVFEYNTTGVCYTATGLTGNATTSCVTPDAITGLTATPDDGTIALSWTNPSGSCPFDGVVVFMREGSAVEAAISKANLDGLADESDFTATANWSARSDANDAFDIAALGSNNTNYIVYVGTGNSVNITGLTNGNTYHISVFSEGGTQLWSSNVTTSATPQDIPKVVIYEVYGGGGNSGATYTNDYVVLYNDETSDVIMSNWSIQYASSSGTSWGVNSFSGTILTKGFFLIQLASGGANGSALPTPDASPSSPSNLSATNGKVALSMSTTTLSGSNPSSTDLLDFVGYGSANAYEGSSAAPSGSNTTAIYRTDDGADTDQNGDDFSSHTPDPKNSSSVQLPVSLTSFRATPLQNSVALDWTTASEENNAFFAVERSSNGRQFETIGNVAGNGTTLEPQAYNFVDATPLAGTNYYRLRQVDFDGTATLHAVVAVEMKAATAAIQIRPTEVQTTLEIAFGEVIEGNVTAQIFNLNGQLIQSETFRVQGNSQTLNVAGLQAGMYFITIAHEGQTSTQKFVKF